MNVIAINDVGISMTTMRKAATMGESKRNRSSKEKPAERPRQYNGNVFAVGAYIGYLREERQRQDDGYSRERLAMRIINDTGGLFSISGSTINTIERARQKSFDLAMIDALTRLVGGSMDDVSALLRVPFEDTDEGIKAAIEVGRDAARTRWANRNKIDPTARLLSRAGSEDMREDLEAVLTDEDIATALNIIRHDPAARGIILRLRRPEE